ncbi:MAG: AbrB/MazE/SpoVT family DNA-binding domain-containing protein [Desulfobacteraceae bacterium]|nr:MAG: AbrB/MazE/SpoVT family DNA-binding domain-containing protein [Desulfobacteraceae bacterium]
MALVRVKKRFQITLPSGLCKQYKIVEGDFINIENKQEGMVLKPAKVIEPDQEYFYSREWQKAETEADKDIAQGKVSGPFKSAKELIKALER